MSAKYAMRYFSTLCGARDESEIEKRVLATNPIMEVGAGGFGVDGVAVGVAVGDGVGDGVGVDDGGVGDGVYGGFGVDNGINGSFGDGVVLVLVMVLVLELVMVMVW